MPPHRSRGPNLYTRTNGTLLTNLAGDANLPVARFAINESSSTGTTTSPLPTHAVTKQCPPPRPPGHERGFPPARRDAPPPRGRCSVDRPVRRRLVNARRDRGWRRPVSATRGARGRGSVSALPAALSAQTGGSAWLGDPTRWCGTCDAMRVLRVAVDVRGGNERREAGSCNARGTSAGGVCWEPRMRRTPLRRGLEAGHGARRDRSAVRRWLLVPCWRPQRNVFGAPEETVKTGRRAGHRARGQRHPAPSRPHRLQRACSTSRASEH
jgi:hypothetical protein